MAGTESSGATDHESPELEKMMEIEGVDIWPEDKTA
jgi:hypothetical protein